MYVPERLAEMLAERGLDAVVACTAENIFYLTGFSPVIKVLDPYRGVCWAVVAREAPGVVHIVHSHGEADQILDSTAEIGHVELYGTFYREQPAGAVLTGEEANLVSLASGSPFGRRPAEAIAALLLRLGLAGARVGLDEDGVSAPLAADLRSRFPAMVEVPASDLLRSVRRIKSRQEVLRLQAAARSVEGAILATAAVAEPGMSERDLAREFERGLLTGGARPSLTMLKVGRDAVFGQRRQTAAAVCEGDILWFDCDAVRDMYWADIARIFAVGDGSRHRHRYGALLAGQSRAIEEIRPGMTGGEVFDLVMDTVHRSGFPEYRRHHVGHGIGLEPYERPILAPGNRDVIEAGMVLSVETPFYEYAAGALHVEDPIRVGVDGNERLTLFDGDMREI
jgi:Xaa-Pro aminopeptidase